MSRRHDRKLAQLLLVVLALACTGCAAAQPTAAVSTAAPTVVPTAAPTVVPTAVPTAAPTVVPTSVPTAVPDLATRIDTYLQRLVGQGRFSGTVLVARKGEVLFSGGYGLADRERAIAMSPQTKVMIGSLTKQFTAVAILMLQAQGKLNVQDLVCQSIDPCPESWKAISIHHLLTHSSGLPEYLVDETKPLTVDKLLASFRDKPLLSLPGEGFRYSNTGYIVLGAIIEQASGQPYSEFLQQNIFTPLGMVDTGYETPADLAASYQGKRAIPTVSPTVSHAAGGLYSTAEDMLRWSQALNSDELLTAELRTTMFSPYIAIPDSAVSYGYGWSLDTLEGAQRQEHSGVIGGFLSNLMRFPEDDLVVIFLCNTQDLNDAFTAAEPIAKMALSMP